MKKSIKSIIGSLLIVGFAIIISLFYMNTQNDENRKGIGIASRNINMDISEDTIFCEDDIIFDIDEIKAIDYDFISDDTYLHNVKMTINNKDDVYSSNVESNLQEGSLYLDKSFLKAAKVTGNTVMIKLSYELDKEYITRYTDTDVLSYDTDFINVDYIKNLVINIKAKDTISNLATNMGKIEQTGNNYKITIDNLKENTINLTFRINTELNHVVGTEYIDQEALAEEEKYGYIDDRISVLLILAVISIIGFILSCVINRKVRLKEYRRETSGLISPALAEAVVDGKIGLKELIMTTIIELNIRGNIRIINNNTIELVSTNDLEPYEQNIVELLFKTNPIRFADINNIFARSNQETLEFTKKWNRIKELLLDKIYSMNIFSKNLTKINKIMGLIAILISINLPLFFLEDIIFYEIFFIISILVTIYYIRIVRNKTTIQEEIIDSSKRKSRLGKRGKKSAYIIITIILMLCIMIEPLIYVAQYHITFLLIILLIICLNIYIIYQSQSNVLTRQGRHEQAELLKLKKYIDEYSLMKNRDLEAVVLWDEYLAYATAFGIPNKVTDTIYEGWYNLNLNLQMIDKILN